MTFARLLRIARLRWRSLVQPDALDAELDRELSTHFEQLVAEHSADGRSMADATMAARRTLGDLSLFKEQSRAHRRVGWMRDLWRDGRHGARHAWRRPSFAAIVVTSLALGIGANAAVLAAIESTLWSPLRLPHADRLVLMQTRHLITGAHDQSSSLEYRTWRTRSRAFDTLAAAFGGERDIGADADGLPPQRVQTSAVSDEWFETFDVRPVAGRLFTADEYRWDNTSQVMVISFRLWQERYALSPAVVGRRVVVNGLPTAIVGVMPQDFEFQDRRIRSWFPLRQDPAQVPGYARLFTVIGRLRPGISVAQAQADVDAVSASLVDQLPKELDWRPHVAPMGDAHRAWAKTPLLALETAVALMLMVACANVGGLLLGRNLTRQHELGMRVALGAGRLRLVRQLFAEGLPLVAGATIAAIPVAWCCVVILQLMMSPPIGAPRFVVTGVGLRLLTLIPLLALLSGVAITLLPALATARVRTFDALKRDGRARHERFSLRTRSLLVAAQIAASLVLMMSGALAVQSFVRLANRDVGFDERNLLTFQFRAGGPAPAPLFARVLTALRSVDGVDAAAGVSDWSLNSILLPTIDVRIGGLPSSVATPPIRVKHFLVTPAFFSTMGTPVVRGREFGDHDVASAPWGVLVNETAATHFWPDEDPIGKLLTMDATARVVIGVVRDMPLHRRDLNMQDTIYVSYLQQVPPVPGPLGTGIFGRMTFVVRHHGGPQQIAQRAQQLVAAIDPNRPLVYAGEADTIGIPMLEFRNYGLALALLGAVAAFIAVIGIYGVVAQAVARQTRDIGIRAALGARRRDILWLVSGTTLPMLAVGLPLGALGALTLPRFVVPDLWGIPPTDWTTLTAVLLVSVASALLATLIPARRAIGIDPAVTLRAE